MYGSTSPGLLFAMFSKAVRISAADLVGSSDQVQAAMPAAIGVANDVPDHSAKPEVLPWGLPGKSEPE